jgi:predicted methyltransferase MtxX (methanogen marker protein 4)
MKNIQELFLQQAKIKKRVIAIAISRPIQETIDSLKRASRYADLVVIGARVDGYENIIEENEEKASEILIDLLKDKKVDGIVRGQVKDSYTLDVFFKKFNMEPIPSNRKLVTSIMQKDKFYFFLTTCSIYQGMTLEDKIYEVESTAKHMRENFGIEPKIAIMSSLRPTSKIGKYPLLDEMAKINTDLCDYLVSNDYAAKEYYFEYESAVWDNCNLIVPSMGLVGNAWVKALLYLGDWNMLACNYLNLGVVYEDGTRNEKDFFWHIVHAVALVNSDKKFL